MPLVDSGVFMSSNGRALAHRVEPRPPFLTMARPCPAFGPARGLLAALGRCVKSSLVRMRSDVPRAGAEMRRIFRGVAFPEALSGREKIEYALWTAWHRMKNPKPPAKEVKESLAFYRACSPQFTHKKFLIDAAGGHGGIALVFRAYNKVDHAVVLDLYEPSSFKNLRSAWLPEDEQSGAAVEFKNGDISEAGWLPSLLERKGIKAEDVIVVACHACSLLSDELIHECMKAKVEFAIMPCCQGEDSRRGKMMLHTAKILGIGHDTIIDISRLGVIEQTPGYKAMMRCIDSAITPQNRILIGLHESAKEVAQRNSARSVFLQRMTKKYSNIVWRKGDEIDRWCFASSIDMLVAVYAIEAESCSPAASVWRVVIHGTIYGYTRLKQNSKNTKAWYAYP